MFLVVNCSFPRHLQNPPCYPISTYPMQNHPILEGFGSNPLSVFQEFSFKYSSFCSICCTWLAAKSVSIKVASLCAYGCRYTSSSADPPARGLRRGSQGGATSPDRSSRGRGSPEVQVVQGDAGTPVLRWERRESDCVKLSGQRPVLLHSVE